MILRHLVVIRTIPVPTQEEKFGQKWRISPPGIIINNPKIIDLFSYKFYVGPQKGGFKIVNYYPWRTYLLTYCPLVPKQ